MVFYHLLMDLFVNSSQELRVARYISKDYLRYGEWLDIINRSVCFQRSAFSQIYCLQDV